MKARIVSIISIAALVASVAALLITLVVNAVPDRNPSSMPTTCSYQGLLNNKDTGQPVVDGNYQMVFRLYETPEEAGYVWEETQTVTVRKGLFNVLLGSVNPLSAGLFDRPLYLGVTVNGEEMTLRQALASVPYAFQAQNADTLDGMDSAEFMAAGNIKHLVHNFVVAEGADVTDGDVAGFVDGYVQKGIGVAFGSEYVFNPTGTQFTSVATLSPTRFVVAFRDAGNSFLGTAVIGNVSGDTVTFSAKFIFNPGDTIYISVDALSSTSFVVTYGDGSNGAYGTAVIGNITGDTITFGSEYVFNPTRTFCVSVGAFSSNKFVVAYQDEGNSSYGTAVIGDISGNTITFGSEFVFCSPYTGDISVAALSSSRFVVGYKVGDYGRATIGDVSGNTIAYGPASGFNAGYTLYTSVAALSSTRFVVAYQDNSNNFYGTAAIGDVSGNTISFGSEFVFNPAYTGYQWGDVSAIALSSTRFVVAYVDGGNSNCGTAFTGEVSGNSIICGSTYLFNQADTDFISVTNLSSSKFVVAFMDHANYQYGTVVIGNDRGKVIGIVKSSGTAGQTVPVIIGGVSDVHSGLVTGAMYYPESAIQL